MITLEIMAAQKRVEANLNKLYGKVIDVSKFLDESKIYVCHVETNELHGVFFNSKAVETLKSSLEHFLTLTDDFSKFIIDKEPMTYPMAAEYLRKWLDNLVLEREDAACQPTKSDEKDAMLNIAMVGGSFLPQYKSYWIGHCISRLLSIINSTFSTLSIMLKGLPANPNEWSEVKAPFPDYLKHMQAALPELLSVVSGYADYITLNYKTLATLLPKGEYKKTAIIGDCNPEFHMAVNGSRKCSTI
jgi:hypothetical protein